MKKIDGLEELWRWVLNVNHGLCQNRPITFPAQQVKQVENLIKKVSEEIKDSYPFYASELPQIVKKVFFLFQIGSYGISTAAYGELYIIIKHLHEEPEDTYMWMMIHPRISNIAKELYLDGHYSSAANRSLVEVETRLRELFTELKPGVSVPGRIGDVMGALLTENGAYHFCDTSTQSGKDYRKGVQLLFEGSFSAYRNPSSHENQNISKKDAFEQIVLASQLMRVLDK